MKSPRKVKAPGISETAEHLTVASYFRKVGLGPGAIAIHIRNERGSAWERLIASKMGVLKGIPDWLILHDGGAGFIELKPRGFVEKMKRGVGLDAHVLSQLATHERLRECGCWVTICETLEEVKSTLVEKGVPLRTESITATRLARGIRNALAEVE